MKCSDFTGYGTVTVDLTAKPTDLTVWLVCTHLCVLGFEQPKSLSATTHR